MKTRLKRFRDFIFKRSDNEEAEADSGEPGLSGEELKRYASSNSRETAVIEMEPRDRDSKRMSLQSGFCESIELMRSISTQLERQAESQNRLIQSVPEALSAIRQNMNLAEIQDRKMIETMSQLNNTLSEMHQSELQSRHYFREMFQQSEKRFQIVALLLVVLAVASMLTSVYF